MPERPPARVLILGWHGSTERQLRAIARWHEGRGARAEIVITPTFRTMGLRGAWAAFGEALARKVDAGEGELVIHAFSNAGFWTMSALLDAMHTRPTRVIVDSAPGFPADHISPLFTARYATMAMLPSLLAQLKRPPRTFHPLLTPPLATFFAGWHLIARRQVRFMASGQSRVIAKLAGVPLLAIWSDADALIPEEHVVRFLDRAAQAGVRVERLHFVDSAHVRHFVQHRAEYFERIARFLDA